MSLEDLSIITIAARAGSAIVVFLLGRWLAGRTRRTLAATLSKTTLSPSLARLLTLLAFYGIMFVALVVSLALIGIPVTVVLGASAVVIVVLGIALQQSISNLAATIIFMLFQPFKIGELIEGNGVMGVVKEIQLFSTVLVTGDNKEITIPNSQIQGNNLVNYTRLGRLRVDFVFAASYADDPARVKQVLHEILAADPRVLPEPAPLVFLQKLSDSSMDFAVRPWAKPDDYWSLQWDLPERVKLRFDAEGISIPFPQRDVHLRGNGAIRAPQG